VALCLAYFIFGFAPMHSEYNYDIKAEQVYDNDQINESVELQNLSQDEQALLYDAFKKSDHFMGGAEVTIEKQERLETFDGWKVVEYEGVYILVAIEGPEEVTRFSGWQPWAVLVFGLFTGSFFLMGLKMFLFPSRFRH
jgi:hypothetical protein